jgi:hypothetical protein
MRVLSALRAQSSLGSSILNAQCELAGLKPAQLTDEDLPVLIPRLVSALARFVAPHKVEAFRRLFSRWDNGSSSPATAESDVCKALETNTKMDGLAVDLLTILASVTPLGTALLKAQCIKVNVDVKHIRVSDLHRLVPELVNAVERFVAPDKAALACRRLKALLPPE